MLLPRKSIILLRRYSSFTNVRVRFAPSPTGDVHLGGLRTALYNYLFAKSHQGTFILRIEDTDQSRKVPGSAERLEEILRWTGIIPDEGPSNENPKYGPYVQSQRLNFYKEHARILLENGAAYHCFCTTKRLELLKRESNRARMPNRYDGRCRQLSSQEISDKLGAGIPYTLRFKIRPFTEGFYDLVYGHSTHNTFESEGDPIIIKADGYPTYHFANVVDDHLMAISHVFRGVEWQISTPKHIMMYEAFGWTPPTFAHLPLVLNADGTKLSKRQNDINIQYLKEQGYFPEAIVNFMAIPGGGFKGRDISGEVIYSVRELVEKFDVGYLTTHSGRLQKEILDVFNRTMIKNYLKTNKTYILEETKKILLEARNLDLDLEDDETILKHLNWASERIHKLTDLINDPGVSFIWSEPSEYYGLPTNSEDILTQVKEFVLVKGRGGNTAIISTDDLRTFARENDLKFRDVMKCLRIAFCGTGEGPPVGEIMDILGLEKSIKRIENAILHLQLKKSEKRAN